MFMVEIEIVYIPHEKGPIHIYLSLQPNSTVQNALDQSGIAKLYPEIHELTVGIFSKEVSRDTVLSNDDRIEIYQPLKIDPKVKRRERARHNKK
jgi:putative ubiquitin-RnfH superfamily antitoxin RatB of RatAB toxin-antitoxin module